MTSASASSFSRRLAWRLNRFLFPPLPSGNVRILEEPGGALKVGLLLSVDVAGSVRVVAVEADGRWHIALWPVTGSAITLPDYADLVVRAVHLNVLHRVPPWRITWWLADASATLPNIRNRLSMRSAGRFDYDYPSLEDPASVPVALIAKLQRAALTGHLGRAEQGAEP